MITIFALPTPVSPVLRLCGLFLVLLGLVLLGMALPAHAQRGVSSRAVLSGVPEDAPRSAERLEDTRLFYTVNERATLFSRPDSTTPYAQLEVRAPVHRFECSGRWCLVQTEAGRYGYVDRSAISNIWLRASKRERRLYMYRGPHLVEVFNADFGYNAFSDKERRGSNRFRDHWRTPEGVFYVVSKNPQSEFYKALVLNYPTAADAQRGLKQGLISKKEHDAIVRAQASFQMPPMDTELGGWVEIHGDGTGAATNWTQGCVAVRNRDMNRLWWWVEVGTPVLIE